MALAATKSCKKNKTVTATKEKYNPALYLPTITCKLSMQTAAEVNNYLFRNCSVWYWFVSSLQCGRASGAQYRFAVDSGNGTPSGCHTQFGRLSPVPHNSVIRRYRRTTLSYRQRFLSYLFLLSPCRHHLYCSYMAPTTCYKSLFLSSIVK